MSGVVFISPVSFSGSLLMPCYCNFLHGSPEEPYCHIIRVCTSGVAMSQWLCSQKYSCTDPGICADLPSVVATGIRFSTARRCTIVSDTHGYVLITPGFFVTHTCVHHLSHASAPSATPCHGNQSSETMKSWFGSSAVLVQFCREHACILIHL